jgi:hypothetical protein
LVLAVVAAPLVDACSGGGHHAETTTRPVPSTTPRSNASRPTSTTRPPFGLDTSGRTDVTEALQAYIDRQPDGATITFPSHARYRLDGTIQLTDRHRLTFVGDDTTFHPVTHGNRIRGQWSVLRGSSLVFRNLTIVGANPQGGTSVGAYNPSLEAQHAFNIYGTNGVEIDHCFVTDIFGDFVYLAPDDSRPNHQRVTNAWVHDCVFARNGRQGISLQGCDNVVIERNTIAQVRRTMFDIEPNSVHGEVHHIMVRHNKFGAHRLNFLSATGGVLEAPVSDVTFDSNESTSAYNFGFKGTIAKRRGPFAFTNNTSSVNFGAPGGFCMGFQYVDGVKVTGNTQPLQSGRKPPMRLAICRDCTLVDVMHNSVPGGVGELVTA